MINHITFGDFYVSIDKCDCVSYGNDQTLEEVKLEYPSETAAKDDFKLICDVLRFVKNNREE